MTQDVISTKKHFFSRFIGFIICASIAFTATGQTATKPILKDDGNKLIIEYSIIDSKPGDRFLIKVIITDKDGNIIDTNSLTGDIGSDITRGKKRIEWEYDEDDIVYETTVNVKIGYEQLNQQKEETPPTPAPSTKSYSRSGLIFQSLALPGLGMTKLKEKPYWIYGVIGWGLAGNAAYFGFKANDYYNSVYNYDRSTENFNQYKTYYYTWLFSACGAGAIWLTDLILVSVSSKSLNQYGFKKFHITPGYDYRTRSPLLTMTYKF